MSIREERLERMSRLVPYVGMEALRKSHAVLFGLGGVGSYAAEALARLGFGKMTLVDYDTVSVSNLNRQIPALYSTIGQKKTAVIAQRLRDIAPDAEILPVDAYYSPDHPVEIPGDCSIVLDAIDTIAAKVDIACVCRKRNIPVISCMGMGNRLDPTQIRIGDLFETRGCPLCRVMRHELRRRGMDRLRCIYSLEKARKPESDEKRKTPDAIGSIAVVPSVAGLYMAYEAFRILTEKAISHQAREGEQL